MAQPNPDYIIALLERVNHSPFPKLMNMRLTGIAIDTARVELTLTEDHLQLYGIVHGGVYATLIDTATFWAVFLRLPENDGLVNMDIKLNYLKACQAGVLVAEGRCLRAGRTISYAEASVRDPAGDLVAHGASTLMALPGKGLHLEVPKYLSPK